MTRPEARASHADLSRRRVLLTASDGLISIAGDTFSKYRSMAEEAVNMIVEKRG